MGNHRIVKTYWYRQRWAVLRRDKFTCQYCGQYAPNVQLHVDHVVPVVEGGTDEVDNLITACWACNMGKEGFRAVLYEGQRHRTPTAERSVSSTGHEGDRSTSGTAATAVRRWLQDQSTARSKGEVAAATGYSPRAVTYALAHLRRLGQVQDNAKRGRGKLWIAANPADQ